MYCFEPITKHSTGSSHRDISKTKLESLSDMIRKSSENKNKFFILRGSDLDSIVLIIEISFNDITHLSTGGYVVCC